MQRYAGRTVVVKYGGHAMGDEANADRFARDVTLLKQAGMNPVIVHGGGPQINAMLDQLEIESRFAAGLRVTDQATVEVVEMVLAGSVNKQLVAAVTRAGGHAVGLCGKDGAMVRARRVARAVKEPDSDVERLVDLGLVGEPERVNRRLLDTLIEGGAIPVIAPIAFSAEGETLNVNADTFAGAIAGALGAKRFLLLTDVAGVLDRDRRLIQELSLAEARALVADGTVSGGMIPKLETCIYAIEQGVEGVVILDGRVPHALLLELLTDHGAGTLIR
jgi:acetylglutamate kinase